MLIDDGSRQAVCFITDDTLTGEAILQAAGDSRLILIRFSNGKYAVLEPSQLRLKLQMWHKQGSPLNEVSANAWRPYLVDVITRETMGPEEEKRLHDLEEDAFLLVMGQDGTWELYTGAHKTRGARPSGEDRPAPAEPPSGGTLSADEIANAPVEAPLDEASGGGTVPAEKRKVNARLKDRADALVDPHQQALEPGQDYNLIFDIGPERSDSFTGSDFNYRFAPGEAMVTITVRLETDDFEIYEDPPEKKLFVPSTGPSKNQAAFAISPKHEGDLVATALFLKDNNFIQLITMKFTGKTGGVLLSGDEKLYDEQPLGRGVEAAAVVERRDVSLAILKVADGYQMILSGATAATATLKMQLPQLKEMVQETRQALLKLVELQVGSHKVYQEDYNIPATVNQQSIVSLAETGYRLFQKIFAGPYADLQTQNLGKKLRQLTQNGQCKIQIFSQDFVLPWGLLYMADRLMPGEAQKDLFLGMSHIVEHIPLQESMQVVSNRMESTNGLAVSLNLNTDIDKATGLPLISSQETYWDGLHAIHPNLQIIRRTTRDEVLKALSGETSTDQVIYFYCHGISNDPADTGGTDTSTLILSNNGRLTLKDLSLYAPIEDQFSSAPLVFINACESAELSPLVYDGFVPYFVAKGARGVIGTEVKVPAKFAVEWAQRFFDRFLKGESIGEATLNLRNEFFEQHNNLLGLLYSLYVDCDTKVVPGIL